MKAVSLGQPGEGRAEMQSFKEHLFKIIWEAGPTGICLEFQLLVGLGWIIHSPCEFKRQPGQPSETLPQNQIETGLGMWTSGGVLALQGGAPRSNPQNKMDPDCCSAEY